MELKSALIVGVGPGLSASLARLFSRHGLQVALASGHRSAPHSGGEASPIPWPALSACKSRERRLPACRRQYRPPPPGRGGCQRGWLLCSGQIRLRRMVGWKDLPSTPRSVVIAEAA